MLRGADIVMVLARPRPDELSHVATLLTVVPTWTRTPGLLLVGPGYTRAEVERALRVPVMGTLPDDPRGARFFCGQSGGPGPDHSGLGRAAAGLAAHITSHVAPPADHRPADRDDSAGARMLVTDEFAAPSRPNGAVPR
jgi:hypothetical protein